MEIKVIFHNKIGIKVQAQIFAERTLISTCVVEPGKSGILTAVPGLYDIFLKNGATGWEVARRLGGMAKTVTLSKNAQGRYLITGV